MKKRILWIPGFLLLSGMAVLQGGCGMTKSASQETAKTIRIGISVYDQYDTYVSELISHLQSYVKEKEKDWNVTIALDIQNADQSQMQQNNQMDDFIEDGVDVAVINLVDRTDASTIIEKAKNNGIPVIFFNRELVEEDLDRWDRLYYVGADAYESGRMQGQILVEECEKDFDAIDKNGDGVLQYVMLEGEAGHNDSQARSMTVVQKITDSGYTLEKLEDEISNWNRDQAETKMTQFLETYDDEIEVVLSNNDDMALGAIDALKEKYSSLSDWPVVLGIDGTKAGLEAVANGEMRGTVQADNKGQAHAIVELAYANVTGEELGGGFTLQDGKYIRLPYQIVTKENVAEMQEQQEG